MAHQQPKAVLRLLLRVVDQHITAVAGNQQWRQHVLQQFRQHRDADPVQQQRLLLIAQEYADLVRNIAHHQELLDTYNIGADPDERNKKMVEKTAARVGFRLPDAAESPAAAAAAQDTATASIPQQQQQQEQDHPPHLSHGTSAASGGSSGSSGSSRKASSPPGPQDRLQGAASLAAA